VRHQRLDNRRGRETADGEALHPAQEVTTIDLAVNELSVQIDRFRGNFPCLLHETPSLQPAKGSSSGATPEACSRCATSRSVLLAVPSIEYFKPRPEPRWVTQAALRPSRCHG